MESSRCVRPLPHSMISFLFFLSAMCLLHLFRFALYNMVLSKKQQQMLARSIPMSKIIAAANEYIRLVRPSSFGGRGNVPVSGKGVVDFLKKAAKKLGDVGKVLAVPILKGIILPVVKKKLLGSGLKLPGGGGLLLAGQRGGRRGTRTRRAPKKKAPRRRRRR